MKGMDQVVISNLQLQKLFEKFKIIVKVISSRFIYSQGNKFLKKGT